MLFSPMKFTRKEINNRNPLFSKINALILMRIFKPLRKTIPAIK